MHAIFIERLGTIYFELLEFYRIDTDPFIRQTSLGLFFGQGVFWLSSYGTHQTTVQRFLNFYDGTYLS